jgi:hypothetical protein
MLGQITLAIVFGLLSAADEEATKPLAGRVVDEKDHPVAGAKVTAFEIVSDGDGWGGYRKRELASITTAADGRFHFDGKVIGKCAVVMATKAGMCFAVHCPHLLSSGEMTLRLGPPAELEGFVVDDAGKPVAGVDLKVVFEELLILPRETVTTSTDKQGRFRIPNLSRDAAIGFDMSASGHARALANGPFVPGQRGLRFVLPPEGRLSGTVVAKDTGKPLANVRLTAMSGVPSGMHHAYAKTDQAGQFTMSGLSGGKYKIETIGEIVNDELMPPEWIGSTEQVEKVEVEAGKLTSNVRIEAVQSGLLELVLVDAATGEPVRDNGVVFVSPEKDLRINHWGRQSKDGVVRLHVTTGSYVITGAVTTAYSLKKPKSDPFRVESGKTNRVTLAVRTHEKTRDNPAAKPAACATGIACDPQGKPVAKANVKVLSLSGGISESVAGDDGRFSIPAANIGLFACFAWIRHPDKDLVALATAALGEADPDEGKLAEQGDVVLRAAPRKVTLQPPVSLSGVVCDPKVAPIVGATVTAQVDASHMGRSAVFLTTTTDKAGRYSLGLAGFTITSYAIVAKTPGYNAAEARVDPSDLLAGGTKAAKLVLYPANRKVRGVVQDEAGRPVPGAVITAKRMDSLAYPGCVVSDAQGRFVLEHLDEADTIYLFAHVPGRGWTEIGATIDPGEKETVIRVGPCSWD